MESSRDSEAVYRPLNRMEDPPYSRMRKSGVNIAQHHGFM